MKRTDIPFDYLHECFEYRDGKLYWKERPLRHFYDENSWKIWNIQNPGKEAGCLSDRDRWQISLGGTKIRRHLIVWAMHHNEWLPEVDHIKKIDGEINDRIENLRRATRSQQLMNTRISSKNTSGYKGVSFCKNRGAYRSYIVVNKRQIHLGWFDDPKEAHKEYVEAAKLYFGEYANAG